MGQEDLLEEGMETCFSILARKIPWAEGPGRPHPWGHKESDVTEATKHSTAQHSLVT